MGQEAGQNQRRRRARRQERGLRRVDAILDAAARTFAEAGYDGATVAAIASRAGVSPGSLYQFFPGKEAVARALAERYAADLGAIHEETLSVEAATLPAALDRTIDPIVAFNRAHPALTALADARASARLADVFDDAHAELIRRFDDLVAAGAPRLDPERRRRIATVAVRIALALLPLTLDPDAGEADEMVGEMKTALGGYVTSALGAPIPTDRSA